LLIFLEKIKNKLECYDTGLRCLYLKLVEETYLNIKDSIKEKEEIRISTY
jgi:hypothetical protein